MNDKDEENESSRRDFGESSTAGPELETSGHGLAAKVTTTELSVQAVVENITSVPQVKLSPTDIPGADLPKPFDQHTVSALRWWLLCRGIKVPTSWRKKQVIDRMKEAERAATSVVDVDGSYLYRKYKALTEAGHEVARPPRPSLPISGWRSVTEDTYCSIASSIPPVTPGLVYTYLAGLVRPTGDQGAFRALARGYTHWASGRLEEMEVNTNHPDYCHVRCRMKPSMKAGIYVVYILMGCEGGIATICVATCECAAGNSASCTHVSAALHALTGLSPMAFRLQPNLPAVDDADDETPITSLPCQWKAPKARKDSTLRMSEATFQKHEYAQPAKKIFKPLEDFDPRPPELRGLATSRLPPLLDKIRGEQLSISLLFDPRCTRISTVPQQPQSQNIPSTAGLKETITAFKKDMEVSPDQAHKIERDTREQRVSSLWFSVRQFRITSSLFGEVLSRRPDTPPDSLVLRIIQPKSFSTAATRYGIENEESAVKQYITHQHSHGHTELLTTPSGFIINTNYSFLGTSPDGAVFDPINPEQPYGFLEVKCPYVHRERTPAEACATSGFCCVLDSTGQLGITTSTTRQVLHTSTGSNGERPWCDFVVFTTKGISVERIPFNPNYWTNILLPKLVSFYDNCVAPEIVSPIRSLGLPIRDLSKQ